MSWLKPGESELRIVAATVDFHRTFPVRLVTNFSFIFDLFPQELKGELISICCRSPLYSPTGVNDKISYCRWCLRGTPTPAHVVRSFQTEINDETFYLATSIHLGSLEAALVAQELSDTANSIKALPAPGKSLLQQMRYRREVKTMAVRRLL